MKKYIFFTIFILFLCGCSFHGIKNDKLSDLDTIRKRGFIIAGVKSDSPPFGYIEDNNLTGIDIEIVKNIALAIFDTNTPDVIHFVNVDAQNRISKLNSREVDILVATMSINPKRELVMNFSRPYYATSQKLMVRRDSRITNLQYFNSKGKLGVVLGTTGERIIRLVAPNAVVVGAKSYQELISLLDTGSVDGVIGDDCILASFNNNRHKIINRGYSKEYYGVGVRKNKDSEELLNIIDATIATMLDKKQIAAPKKQLIKEESQYELEDGAKVVQVEENKDENSPKKIESEDKSLDTPEEKTEDNKDIKEDTEKSQESDNEKTETDKDEQKQSN